MFFLVVVALVVVVVALGASVKITKKKQEAVHAQIVLGGNVQRRLRCLRTLNSSCPSHSTFIRYMLSFLLQQGDDIDPPSYCVALQYFYYVGWWCIIIIIMCCVVDASSRKVKRRTRTSFRCIAALLTQFIAHRLFGEESIVWASIESWRIRSSSRVR